jgi:hypothetical protein
MITTEVVALAIAAWFLMSFLFGLAAGRIIQICRCAHPGACEICRLPDEQEPQSAPDASAEPKEHAGIVLAG